MKKEGGGGVCGGREGHEPICVFVFRQLTTIKSLHVRMKAKSEWHATVLPPK